MRPILSQAENAYKDKNYKQAGKLFRLISIDEPENFMAFEGLAQSLYYQGKYHEAEEIAQRILVKEPNSEIAHQIKAYIYARKKNYELSEIEIKKAYDLNKSSPETLAFFGGILYFWKNSEDGLAMINEAIRLNPYDWLAHYYLGSVKKEKRCLLEAVHEFKTANKLHPSFRTILPLLDLYLYQKRFWVGLVLCFLLALSIVFHSFIPIILFVCLGYIIGIRLLFKGRWIEGIFFLAFETVILLYGKHIF
jgi:tetratricopeptide (TPR) repeat protein